MGINTIGDLYNNLESLKDFFGEKMYEYVKKTLEGKSSNVVDPDRYSSFSSIGNSRTSTSPLVNEDEINEFLNNVCEITYNRLKKYRVLAYTFTIQIRYTNFKTYSKSKTYNEPTNDKDEFFNRSKELFDSLWDGLRDLERGRVLPLADILGRVAEGRRPKVARLDIGGCVLEKRLGVALRQFIEVV